MDLIDQLAAELQTRMKAAVPSAPTVGAYAHGPGGLFSYPGLDQNIFNAAALPRLGLLDLIPSRTSNYTDPLFGIITGVTAGSGSNPTGVCDDFPVAGLMKLCTHTAPFGRYGLNTPTVDVDRIGRAVNRSDFNDYNIIGGPNYNNPVVPTVPGAGGLQNAARGEFAKIMLEFAVEWGRRYARMLYTGSTENNTSGGGYKEFYGLDILINTGYRDAVSQADCDAADSLIQNFNNQQVELAGQALVSTLVNMMRYLMDLADQTGLAPATWAIAMPRQMFWQITEIWPCAYMTYQCRSGGYFAEADARSTDSAALIGMRDDMRRRQYLIMDGIERPVVFDDAITYTKGAGGTFTSQIYIVPLRVRGGTPVTYMEYINYDADNGALAIARMLAPEGQFFTSDGGRFLWTRKAANNFCVQMMAKSEPRLVLRTPYLAARLLNVKYTPLLQNREWDPAGPSFINGGTTNWNSYWPPSFASPTA